MVNKKIWLGILAAVLVFGMAVVSCNDDPTNTPDIPPDNSAIPIVEPPEGSIYLYAKRWGQLGAYQAEQWDSDKNIKFSDLFDLDGYQPKQGDVLKIKISGNADKELKFIKVNICDSKYTYLGGSEELKNISASFEDFEIDEIKITAPVDPNEIIFVQLVNLLWQKRPNGTYDHNGNETIPADIPGNSIMATISGFSIGLVEVKTINDSSDKERWRSWADSTTGVTIKHEVDEDDVCAVTVGGTIADIWKANVQYQYIAERDKHYAYTFEAWTDGGDRTISLQYYYDDARDDPPYLSKSFTISATKETRTVIGETIPKAGVRLLEFQCANQLGEFYIKIISIEETTEQGPDKDRWWSYTITGSKANLQTSVDDNDLCTIVVTGSPEEYDSWKASACYNYTGKKDTLYSYKFEAWTKSGDGNRPLYFQYYGNAAEGIYRGKGIEITETQTQYTIYGQPLPTGGALRLDFQCAAQIGTFYVKIISIEEADPQPQILTITGIDSKYDWISVSILDTDMGFVANSSSLFSNGSVMLCLWDNEDKPWDNAGNYLITIFCNSVSGSGSYIYTGGKELDPSSYNTYTFTKGGSYTISFDQFVIRM